MQQQTLKQFEAQCIQDEPPACQTMCPLHVEARSIAALAGQGKWNDARKLLERSMPLVSVSAYLCEGPCRDHCRRAELDEGVNLPMLERLCVMNGRAVKTMPLPPSGKKVAIAGGGLSSLAVAWELGRKGHLATIFHSGPIGGGLNWLDEKRLPREALTAALGQLSSVRVTVETHSFSKDWLNEILENFNAVYLGLDDETFTPADLGLSESQVFPDYLTMGTSLERVFAGPADSGGQGRLFINQLAGAKRAAGSIDRILQGVSAASARDMEDIYPTRLYTSLEEIEVCHEQLLADKWQPTDAEGRAEGARCIQCQCLECVKRCIFLKHYKGYPKKYGREIYNNLSVVHGQRRANTMINSCAQCGLCREICPLDADMGDFTAKARREMTATNRMPPSAHEFALEDMVYSNHPSVAFTRHAPGAGKSEWLFFPGCQLPATLPEATMSVYQHLRANLGEVGFLMSCCGAPAKWSGRPRLTGSVAGAIKTKWQEMGRPKMILACSSCALFFKEELAAIPYSTLWDVLAELPAPPSSLAAPTALALHDPCAARHDEKTRNSVRQLLKNIGQLIEELPLGGQLTRCCGYGGLASAANPEVGELYAMDRAKDTGLVMASYCAMCRDKLREVEKPSLHLLDLLFPGGSIEDAASRPAPGISDRQEARLNFRRAILSEIWNETEPSSMENLKINIDEALLPVLESRRILRSDIQDVLKEARDNGPQFFNPDSDVYLTSLRPRQVTFWVQYTMADDGSYNIHDAYCHRMVAPATPGQGADSPASLEGYAAKGGRI
ncbi:hypothetical protein C4J81_04065 [Deltaproteobacteria bacterium Smac51]|nr:hypothetical protein C4J81_04065 [Deltaproteobacteria bacterium Smac51]